MDDHPLNSVSAFGLGMENTAYEQYFVGKSYLNPLCDKEINVVNVTFEPGCRNHWHIHRGCGQVLACVGGSGWYQQEGSPARRLSPGDVVYIAPDVKHWHGAAVDQPFAHLAMNLQNTCASTQWCEAVDAEAYAAL